MNRLNQPDRLSLDSFMDTTTASNGLYNTFVNHSPNTALVGAKKIAMLRATIPYIQPSIPNYSTVFYYYKMASATALPAANVLKAVRLYSNDYIPPSGFSFYTLNKFFNTPQDLVDALNAAASAGGDSVTYNTLWVADDITFTYDAVLNQIYWEGSDVNSYYCSAGYNDPFVLASQASTAITTYNFDTTTSRQPFTSGYTLNLRTGFAMDGVNIPRQSGTALLSVKCANLGGKSFAGGVEIYADSYANLNYTGTIYLYANIVGNSGYGSVNKKNLLAVVPVNVPAGGVISYEGHSTPAYSLKVSSEIYDIHVEMRDEANMPFLLPDSANVNIELNVLYE
jgi:hypothetical protein